MVNTLSNEARGELLEALYSIRLELCTQKIIAPTIKKTKLEEIINSSKKNITDKIVSQEIDKLFEEYFIATKNEPVSNMINNLDSKIDEKNKEALNNSLSNDNENGKTSEKGYSKILHSSYFKPKINDES